MHDILAKAILQATKEYRSDNMGRIFINQNGLDTPILVHFRELGKITPEVILSEIMKVLQRK